MERREAYKDSGVKWIGEIPEEWDVTKFNIACTSSLGKMLTNTPRTASAYLGCYLKAANVQEDGFDLSTVSEMFFDSGDEERYGITSGDLLVVEGGSVGLAHVWTGAITPCYIQNALHRVRPSEGFCTEYLKYSLDLARYAGYIDLVCNKATIAHFTKEKLLTTPLLTPPLVEQQAIADFLDAKTAEIDALVADCEREVELLQEYRKAVVSEAVTKGIDPDVPMKDSGVEWIGEIPKKWSIDRLSSFIVSISSGVSVNGAAYPAADNELGVLKTSSVYHDIFTATENKQVNLDEADRVKCPVVANRLIVSRMNTPEWVGACGYVERDFPNLFLPDRLWQIEIGNKASCKYVYYWLQSRGVKSWISVIAVGTSGSMKNIAQREFAQLPIALPPLDEQIEIVECLEAKTAEIDALVEAKQTMVGKLREYRRSLVSEAVTGKFKVPGVDE